MQQIIKICLSLSLIILITTGFATSSKKLPQPGAAPIVRLDKIIAVVNNEIITQHELDAKISMAKRQMRLSHTPIPAAKQLHDQALNLLIMQSLQMQIAKRAGISITDSDLDSSIQSIAQRNNASITEMRKTLQAQGISYKEFRKQIKTQMLIAKVQQAAVGKQVNVSALEIKGMRGQLHNKSPLQYKLADLLVALPDSPTPQDIKTAKQKAASLLAKIKSGQSFQAVAAAYSASSSSVSGGDLGWQSAAELPDIFVAAVKNHVTRSVVGPIQAGNGFHLLKILGKRRSKSGAANDEQIRQMIWQRKFSENVAIWLQQLRSSAYIKIEH
jgi:peptidyl-prolyl cis-trans isomerase SurA